MTISYTKYCTKTVLYTETIFSRPEIIETKYGEIFTSELDDERDNWNKTLLNSNSKSKSDIQAVMFCFVQSINSFERKEVHHKYESFLEKINDAYLRYVSESSENIINKFHQASYDSLLQLARFIPELPEKNLDVYLDEMTGCFGVTIKIESKGKPVLNLLMRENKEVIFSFIKRKNKTIKISGRAYFNDDLNDSDEIKNIIRMITQ